MGLRDLLPFKKQETPKEKDIPGRYTEGVDFQVHSDSTSLQGWSYIELLKGKFKGVKYHYGKVQFSPEKDEAGQHRFRFNYFLRTNGMTDEEIDAVDKLLESSEVEFERLLGDILLCIMEQEIENGNTFS